MSQLQIYRKLLNHFGKQYWWPAESDFEVIIGALLTQQSTWKNVERAIGNMKSESLLTSKAIAETGLNKLEECVRPTGFYRQKARRVRKFVNYIENKYNGNLELLFSKPLAEVRDELLSLEGVGSETADSILLYAGDKPVFPIMHILREFTSVWVQPRVATPSCRSSSIIVFLRIWKFTRRCTPLLLSSQRVIAGKNRCVKSAP
jgi:endonuclease III-like uncharacterized protein